MERLKHLILRLSPGLIALALFFIMGYAPEALVFDRAAISNGEFWRLITGHFAHCDLEHLVLNLIGIWSLILIFDGLTPRQIWLSLAAGMAAVDIWLWFGMRDLALYCGLSGIENSLLVSGLLSFYRQGRSKWLIFSAGGLCLGKIIYEILSGTAIFSSVSWQSVPQTHAAGFVAGVLMISVLSVKADKRLLRSNEMRMN